MLLLPPCSTEALHVVLDRSVPYVWVIGHDSGSYAHWWNAAVPFSEGTSNRSVLVRDLRFDILMTTEEFLRYEPEFRHGGILLVQLDRRVPDTRTNPRSARARTSVIRLRRRASFISGVLVSRNALPGRATEPNPRDSTTGTDFRFDNYVEVPSGWVSETFEAEALGRVT